MRPKVDITSLDITVFAEEEYRTKALAAMPRWRLEKIKRIKSGRGKWLSLAVGVLLDEVLKPLGRRLQTEAMIRGENGKPAFADSALPRFSATHSGRVAMLAVVPSSAEVGLDYESFREKPRPNFEALLNRIAGSDEKAYVRVAILPREREERFLRLWTAKEAVLKYLGAGLTLDPRSMRIAIDAETPDHPRAMNHPELWLEAEVLSGGVRTVCVGPALR